MSELKGEAFIVSPPPIMGLNPQKAQAFGLPIGPEAEAPKLQLAL